MADAMVTARMSQEKKEAGNRVFEQLGTNASQVVNCLYDYAIEKKMLPFSTNKQHRGYTKEDLAAAKAWVDGITRLPENNRFAYMTDKEIKMERLRSRGYFDEDAKE